MREGSPPHREIKFYLLTTDGGAETDGCSRAGQRCGLEPAKVKNDKAMKYDLFAEFYENSSEKPRYVVWMGSIYPKTVNELESMGFQESVSDGYLDYVKKKVSLHDLEKLTQPGFECEMLDVIDELAMIDDPDEVYNERVKIIARELEVIKGEYPKMGVMVGNTFVEFIGTKSMKPVFFGLWNEDNKCEMYFRIPVIKLKRHFKVLTLMEIKKKLKAMNVEKKWTFEELKEIFCKIEKKTALMTSIQYERAPHNMVSGNFMIDLPKEDINYDYKDESDCLYAEAFYFLMDGYIQDGKRKLEESYSIGNLDAGLALAYGYSVGWFGEPDYVEHIKILKELVKKGLSGAMSYYAFAYEFGFGVKRNKRQSLFWYEQAIAAGSPTAMANMASYYLFNEEGRPHLKKGIEYVMKAAEMGNEQAMNDLGMAYELGLVTGEKDGENAFKWYTLAVQNDAGAIAEHNLSICYKKGFGTVIDLQKAEEFEKLAIEHEYKPKIINYKYTKSKCYFGLFAEFYENSIDEKPLYTVLMGCRKLPYYELVDEKGFYEDSQLHDGFIAFIKENVTQQDLEELTKPQFHSEMIDVLYDQDYERIRIVAWAYTESKRYVPIWATGLNHICVEFTHSEPLSPVIFMDCESETKNGKYTRTFKVPLIKLKEYFNVKTLYEVFFKVEGMNKERKWTYDELKNLFYDDESL